MILFKNALIRPMDAAPFTGDIAIENGKIAALGPALDIPGAETRDMTGMQILPGLVDAHCHIGLQETGTREVDHNEKGTPCTPQMRAIDALFPADAAFADSRRLGITTLVTGPGSINLIGGSFAAVKPVGHTVEKMLLADNIAMKMAFGENPKFRYNEMGRHPRTRMGIAAIIREELTRAKSYAAKKAAGTLTEINLEMEALVPVMEGKMPMKIHCHRADDIATAVRIMKEFGLRFTLDHVTEGHLIPDVLEDALANGCEGLIIGPLLCFSRKLERRYNLACEFPARMYELGFECALCTDLPDSPQESLLLCAGRAVAEGMPEEAALRTVTINAAKAVGLADRVGSLAVGKDADLAIFNGHPLDCRTLCVETWIDGECVYKKK